MAKKMPRGLVALSSSAIAAIYLTGYVATQGADSGIAAPATATPIAVAARVADSPGAGPSVAPTPVLPRRQPANPAPNPPSAVAPPSTAPADATGPYRDGVYNGQGTSRRGGFKVAVTIQGGRITDVTLTQVTTQYPASRIAALPGQVIARQSANVDRVTGATYSVQAFQQAVQQALAQARTGGAAASAPADAGTPAGA